MIFLCRKNKFSLFLCLYVLPERLLNMSVYLLKNVESGSSNPSSQVLGNSVVSMSQFWPGQTILCKQMDESASSVNKGINCGGGLVSFQVSECCNLNSLKPLTMTFILDWAGFNWKCKIAFIFSVISSVCIIQIWWVNQILLLDAAAPALEGTSLCKACYPSRLVLVACCFTWWKGKFTAES